jgi:hypothetical protein
MLFEIRNNAQLARHGPAAAVARQQLRTHDECVCVLLCVNFKLMTNAYVRFVYL